MRFFPAVALLSVALVACSQEDAPSEAISKAADKVVEQVKSPAATLAKGPYAPRDECADVKGSGEFRTALAMAVQARDANALIGLAAKDVKLDFGGGSGTAELRKRLSDPKYDLWDELATLVTLGCAKSEEGGIVLPWYFAQDFGQLDVLNSIIVMGEDVPLRETADAAGKIVQPISWDAVTIVGGFKPDAMFQQVETADGTVGFVPKDKLRPIAGYRLLASSRDGEWSFTALIAGD